MNVVEGRPRVYLVGAAVVVAVLVVVSILAWGLVALPSYPSLSDDPDPGIPGTVAYLGTTDRAGSDCLEVVAAGGGQPRELVCFDGTDDRWPEQVGWTADGQIVVTVHGPAGPRFEIVDPQSGRIVRTGVWEGRSDGLPVPDGSPLEGVEVRTVAGRVTVTVTGPEGSTTVLDVEGPRSYTIWEHQRSPDGQWLLLVDSEQRALVVPVDGSIGPRLLVDHARSPAWWVAGHGSSVPIELS